MFEDLNPWVWLTAFASMSFLDVAWVWYTKAVTKNAPISASLWAGAIHAFSAIAVVTYVDDKRYLTATMVGTLLGTYLVVLYERRKDAKSE